MKKNYQKKIFPILFILLIFFIFFVFKTGKNEKNEDKLTSPNKSVNTSQASDEDNDKLKGAAGLNELVSGKTITPTDEFDQNAYIQIGYDEFIDYISSHYNSKRATNFKGISIFNESYRVLLTLPHKPASISNDLNELLLNAVGEKSIADNFTHAITINIDGINFYYFIQNKLALDIIDKWDQGKKYELFVFIPFTNHYDEYIPILVNATAGPLDAIKKSPSEI